MFEELLALAGLILALYGLACIISSFALWLTAPSRKRSYKMLVFLEPGEGISHITSVRERLKNGGLGHCTQIVAVDNGLNAEESEKFASFCHAEGVRFCKREELFKLLQISSFQTTENKV